MMKVIDTMMDVERDVGRLASFATKTCLPQFGEAEGLPMGGAQVDFAIPLSISHDAVCSCVVWRYEKKVGRRFPRP